LIYSHKQLISY